MIKWMFESIVICTLAVLCIGLGIVMAMFFVAMYGIARICDDVVAMICFSSLAACSIALAIVVEIFGVYLFTTVFLPGV